MSGGAFCRWGDWQATMEPSDGQSSVNECFMLHLRVVLFTGRPTKTALVLKRNV